MCVIITSNEKVSIKLYNINLTCILKLYIIIIFYIILKNTNTNLIKYMTKALFDISVINTIQIFFISLSHGERSINPVSWLNSTHLIYKIL